MSESDHTNGGESVPTTAIPYDDPSGIPRTTASGDAAGSKQRRLVGNVFEGQVLVDLDAYEYDRDATTYENYNGHTWEITHISDDGRSMMMEKRDGEDAGRQRAILVAQFAREHIRGERWMILKDGMVAPTWTVDTTTECQNCGVTRDTGLSREEHFETSHDGRAYNATLRRCVGCGNFGVLAFADDGRTYGLSKFTTGILEGPDAPWDRG